MGEVKLTRCPGTCGAKKREIKDANRWRRADRWDLMEYLWDKEKADDFAYWLEEKCEQEAKMSYWDQMKEPRGYFNSDKYPWILLTMEANFPDEKGTTIYAQSMEKKTPEELVPTAFHKYLTVFEQEASECMPVCKPWDHAIDLKPDFQPKKGKIYPLSPEEQKEVQDFLSAQLEKGYIRPSKSPQTSPVFFIAKKDDKNEWSKITATSMIGQ
jgi:hypothetical protein